MKNLFKAFTYPKARTKSEHSFLAFICVAFMVAMFITPYPQYAMWTGFLFAAYAADAMIVYKPEFFIASNQDKKWWVLWLFIGMYF